MFNLVLAAQLFVSAGGVSLPPWNKIDREVFEAIRREAERLYEEEQHRKKMAEQSGCPFEPGTYWNLECA